MHKLSSTWLRSLSIAVFGALAAIGGALAGSEQAATLAHQQWKFDQVSTAYSSLSSILDRSMILSAELPIRWQLMGSLAKINQEAILLENLKRN